MSVSYDALTRLSSPERFTFTETPTGRVPKDEHNSLINKKLQNSSFYVSAAVRCCH